jgi:hypothetical protein
MPEDGPPERVIAVLDAVLRDFVGGLLAAGVPPEVITGVVARLPREGAEPELRAAFVNLLGLAVLRHLKGSH